MVCWVHITQIAMISPQLTRPFISSQRVGFQNWPKEYKENFVPLISHYAYQEGSLRADSLVHTLKLKETTNIKALPPVVEKCTRKTF